ncbi:MAG: selenocysteine-specific elongation factor, partial [Actinomycetota bacterium]|nr:selenocysteine-specific elongation factor [Actinomycetota bacterium]
IDRVVALAPPAPDLGRPRLWVDRAFTIAGAGTVVTGTLAGGSFRRGDEVVVSPHGLDARVRALQTHNREVDEAVPGSRVAMNLTGLSRDSVRRGNAIVAPGRWRETRTVDARIEVVSEALAGRAHRLTEKGAHLLYTGSAETPVRIKLLGSKALEAGTSGYARLRLRDELPLAPGDRFVLRDAGRVLTFGGGTVLDPGPPTRPIDDGRVKLLEHLENASPRVAAIALVEYEGRVPVRDLRARVGTSALPDEVVVFGSVALSATRAQAQKERLAEIVAGHHRDHPLERGVATESVRANLDLDAATFGALVDATSSVIKDAALLRLSDHQVSLGDTESAERADLLKRLDGSAFAPPMAEELQIDRALLKALVDAGDLVPIKGFYLTKARADEAKALVRQAIEERGPVTVAQIRDLLGTTRKYAVPLCEWLDATGTTLRRGDVRLLGPRS